MPIVLSLFACAYLWSEPPLEEPPAEDPAADAPDADAPTKRERRQRKRDEAAPAEDRSADGEARRGGGGGGGRGGGKPVDAEKLVAHAIQGTSMTVGQLPASCQPTAEGAPASTPIAEWLAKHQKKADAAGVACGEGGAGHRCTLSLRRTEGREWLIEVSFEVDGEGALQTGTLGCVLAG